MRVLIFLTGMVLAGWVQTGWAEPLRIRVSELEQGTLDRLQKGELDELIIEFRNGDSIPVNLVMGGDLLESADSQPVFMRVKRQFWLSLAKNRFHLSTDGENYRPFADALSGNITVGVTSESAGGGFAKAIQVVTQAHLKP